VLIRTNTVPNVEVGKNTGVGTGAGAVVTLGEKERRKKEKEKEKEKKKERSKKNTNSSASANINADSNTNTGSATVTNNIIVTLVRLYTTSTRKEAGRAANVDGGGKATIDVGVVAEGGWRKGRSRGRDREGHIGRGFQHSGLRISCAGWIVSGYIGCGSKGRRNGWEEWLRGRERRKRERAGKGDGKGKRRMRG
jgi:hypothetical protein